jgi:hypothetical protein
MVQPAADGEPASPRADLADAAGWLLLGVAVLAASLAMDRLGDQDVPPFAAPGLLPGLLGIGLVLLGAVLLTRSLRQGRAVAVTTAPGQQLGRAALAIALCVLFGAVLVGHGLPFWLAAAVFVTVAILLLQRGQPHERRFDIGNILVAAAIGLGTGAVVTVLFQQVFLVRLP